jgi:hypothetical protein
MTAAARKLLPNRRASETFNFAHQGHDYIATVSRDNSGKVAEIFLNASKSGTAIEAYAHDAALMISIALQYGVPLSALCHAVKRDSGGHPSSPIGTALDQLARGDLVHFGKGKI